MEMYVGVSDWLFANTFLTMSSLLVLLITSFGTSFINATIGVGGGVLMLAMLLLILPAEAVIPVHAIIQLISNIGRTTAYRTDINRTILVSFAPGCLIGSIAAAFILINIPGWLLEFIIGLFIVWTLFDDSKQKSQTNRMSSYFGVGSVTSFISSFVGATGPLVMAFLYKEKMQKQALIGTHGACMTIQHFLKLLAFGLVGISVIKWTTLVILLGMAGFAGTFLGRKILFLLPEKLFLKLFRTGLILLSINILSSASVSASTELKTILGNSSFVINNSRLHAELAEIHNGVWWYRIVPNGALTR